MKTKVLELHQRKVWNQMLRMIEDYKNDLIQFPSLVKNLEGALDASELQDKDLVTQWYELWQPLEITNAIKGNKVYKEQVMNDIEGLETFIQARVCV